MLKVAVVAAGGSGGHLFPAQALADVLKARGWRIVLASDNRVEGLSRGFPADERVGLSARTFTPGDPIEMARAGVAIARGVLQARTAFRRIGPRVVVGFGGYPSVPGLLAAITLRVPTVVHEQNAVMGRANRRLVGHVTAVACAFSTLHKAPPDVARHATVVGNPVRPEIRALHGLTYVSPQVDGQVRVLITGGSQGARFLSERMPEVIRRLPEGLRRRLKVQQQTRNECMQGARRAYDEAMVEAELAPFFRNMAGRLSDAHLVIGRSGAGTVCEIAIAARPAILVPLAISLDDDQGQNGKVMADAGGALVVRESEFDIDSMADTLQALLSDPERLARMAEGARSIAKPDAAQALADLVERTAENP